MMQKLERGINKYKVAVIIPCYNEQEAIESVINEIKSKKFDAFDLTIIAVNDCSKDNTLHILQSLNVTILNLPINLGIGGAVQTGYKYALKNKFDVAIQLDGDGQHPVDQIEKIVKPILEQVCDVAIGSRFIHYKGFQSSFLRRIGIVYIQYLNRFLIGLNITDSTSGFRAINAEALKLVCKYYPDEYPEPEAIILFSLNKLTILEVPVIMKERQGGVSSIRSFKTIYYMAKVTLANICLYLRLKNKL